MRRLAKWNMMIPATPTSGEGIQAHVEESPVGPDINQLTKKTLREFDQVEPKKDWVGDDFKGWHCDIESTQVAKRHSYIFPLNCF